MRGFLGRRRVRRQEQLNVQVPLANADAVRDAIEQWLRGKGVTAAVTTQEEPGNKVRIQAKLGEADTAKLDISADDVQAELQDVLFKAIGRTGSD